MEQLAVKKATRFLRSAFFFKPANTILVPGTIFLGFVTHWSIVSASHTMPESVVWSFISSLRINKLTLDGIGVAEVGVGTG